MKHSIHRSLAVFGVSSVFSFWVNATGHAWYLWRDNPLVREHKATLEFRSAIFGDSTLLPLINVMLDRQLNAWGDGLSPGQIRRGRLLRSLLVGLGVTASFHVYQGTHRLVNWTMPRPWRWNLFGYYHAFYMTVQATLMAYFCGAAGTRVRDEGTSALFTRRIVAAIALLLSWFALLYKDYY